MYTIYKIENLINGKVYIGFDSQYPRRISVHKSASKKGDTKFYRAVQKYGWENFVHSVLYQSTDREYTLNEMEPFFIQEHNSFLDGYNSTLGGDGCFGLVLSSDARRKISEGNKVKPKQDEEWVKRRISSGSETRKKKKAMGISYSPSEKTKALLSSSTKGIPKPFSADHRAANLGHVTNLNSRKSVCPHCAKEGQHTNMMRWHFDRCKFSPTKP